MVTRAFQAFMAQHPLFKAGVAIAAAAALAFAVWTISPLFVNVRVDESFPAAVAQPAAHSDAMSAPTAPVADAAAMPATTGAMDAAEQVAAEPVAAVPAEPAAPAGPIALSSGSFTRIDRLHAAEGMATVYTLPDGARVLRLENFSSTNGPDLFIGLSGHAAPRSSAELHDQGYFELERLKGNQGNQNYELPADLDLSQYQSVVIYCKAFGVVFSTATLMAL